MRSSNTDDLRIIFGDNINEEVLIKLIRYLKNITTEFGRIVKLKTRNDFGHILSRGKIKYFSFLSKYKKKPVIFAGALEEDGEDKIFPVIRFRQSNVKLSSLPNGSYFPFTRRKEKWICIKIDPQTIDSIYGLMRGEIKYFLEKFNC